MCGSAGQRQGPDDDRPVPLPGPRWGVGVGCHPGHRHLQQPQPEGPVGGVRPLRAQVSFGPERCGWTAWRLIVGMCVVWSFCCCQAGQFLLMLGLQGVYVCVCACVCACVCVCLWAWVFVGMGMCLCACACMCVWVCVTCVFLGGCVCVCVCVCVTHTHTHTDTYTHGCIGLSVSVCALVWECM